eukprot:CAMPEP_0170550940 /NCGR_PEP_ID=MMETSP0211-20121228/8957_1 /TAXON_ID=311385 /ORGANISM="Pseudokeronopsis sp., Strain OXSARD2" /LENGTH=47 /DNA_ID= /DNA_START= /DNA_END= /DNA_ORIENTATION=
MNKTFNQMIEKKKLEEENKEQENKQDMSVESMGSVLSENLKEDVLKM